MWLSGPDSNKDKHPDVGILLIVREKILACCRNFEKYTKENENEP